MENQIILVDKPADISSFGAVAKVRAKLKTEFGHKVKVGHTGTLDPFATGLLILLSGKMTKKSSEFLKLDKVYEATLKLGYTSTTGDPEGEISKYPNSGAFGGYDREAGRSARDDGPERPRPPK
jgi:tRNA pseudouridine55 synthase